MGNTDSTISLKILLGPSVPESSYKYITALMQPWRFNHYELVKVQGTFDEAIKLDPNSSYAIVDMWDPFSEARLARFRTVYPVLVLFATKEDQDAAFESVKPTKPYQWSRFAKYGEGIELNSAGDARYSPLFMKLGQNNLETIWQLEIKGLNCYNETLWKEVKGLPPVQLEVISEIPSRGAVGSDRESIYVFPDALDRNSGSEWAQEDAAYCKLFNLKGTHYPKSGPQQVRGLRNAVPLTLLGKGGEAILDPRSSYTDIGNIWRKEANVLRRFISTHKFTKVKVSKEVLDLIDQLPRSLRGLLSQFYTPFNTFPFTEYFFKTPEERMKEKYRQYFEKNPSMLYELAVLGKDKLFTERYATTPNTQVKFYCELLNERYGLEN